MLVADPEGGAVIREVRPADADGSVTVLLVEDETTIAQGLTASLEAERFEVVWVPDGQDAVGAWEHHQPDVVLLDLMLPGRSGVEIARDLRLRSDVPIIMVTAKDAEVDRIVGLEVGADDYVTKPFSTRELVARIHAVLRRSRPTRPPDIEDVVEAAGVRVDRARWEVHVGGQPVELPRKEFELLEVLVDNAGRVVTRGGLMDQVWGPGHVGDTKTLDVHIRRLRRRIEPDPGDPQRIQTVRGVGYKFTDDI